MKRKTLFSLLLALAALALGVLFIGLPALVDAQGPEPQAALGTAFTHQGYLTDDGSPANGIYDFQFKLYDAPSNGTQVGSTATKDDVTVTDGLFTVELDFGSGVFDGTARFLEIGVRTGDSTDPYTILSPRQALTPVPYALALPGLWTEQNATSPNLIGGYSGNSVTEDVVGATIGGGGASDDPNGVTGDYGTVGGGRGNTASGPVATVGGGVSNLVTGTYATVGGGYHNAADGFATTVGGGKENSASGYIATVGGGWANTVSDWLATVGGGWRNTASGYAATVGGGVDNTASGHDATVGGGAFNTASGDSATVGGGAFNTASGHHATVGGGLHNTASGSYATVGGGYYNTVSGYVATVGGGDTNEASGYYATVGGGRGNTASGYYATVGGGQYNAAQGFVSFAAGRRVKANHDGAFVWADSQDFDFASTAINEFSARATGGARFVLAIDDRGNPTWTCSVSNGGWWSCSSDRDLKENLIVVDGYETLVRLSRVPIFTWNAKGQDPSIRHMGPMAQDFYAAFKVGEDDRHIATIDLDGVALAAI